KPNFTLQMGRRMAARGLWDKALDYYLKAQTEEPLPAEAQIELAEIYLKLERPDQAIEILNRIPPEGPEAARVAPLMERARELKAAPTTGNKPPKVTR
ncbi:MAG: tetratricopeptide repeat protein, partial [bacterium]